MPKTNRLKQKREIIASVIFVILQYMICTNVFLMGDDYMYGTFAKEGIFPSVYSYYFTGNGRWLLNLVDSFLLKFDRYLYVAILPFLMLLFAWLLYRVACRISDKKDKELYGVSLMVVSLTDVMIARETIYWITGMVNYLLPAILFLAAIECSYKLSYEKEKRVNQILCVIVCIIASMTMEQNALMTVGWLTLFWGYKLYTTKRIKKIELITYILSIVALASILLAPGNFVRVEAAQETQSIVIKLIDLFYNNYASIVSLKMAALISVIAVIVLNKQSKNALSVINFINLIWIILNVNLGLANSMLLALISFVVFVIDVFTLYVCGEKVYVKVCLLILAIGSQVMLLISTIWGFRTSFSVIVVYALILLVMMLRYSNEMCLYAICCTALMLNNIYLGILGCLICMIYNKKMLKNTILTIILPCTVMIVSSVPIGMGYATNKQIHMHNTEQAMESVLENKGNLLVKSYIDEIYGWNSPPLHEFHENYYRRYYGIKEDVEIEYLEGDN